MLLQIYNLDDLIITEVLFLYPEFQVVYIYSEKARTVQGIWLRLFERYQLFK